MATNLNAFTVMGNVTADPKVFAKQNGFTSVLFQLAVNRGNATDFIPVQLYGAQYSDHVKSKLVKGAPVLVHGRVEYTSSEQNGESRKFFALQPGYMQIGPNGNMNTGIIFGRLTADPDIRQAKNGSKVVSITVACNRSYKDANGDWKDAPTTYIDVICWDKLGEFVGQYFRKGNAILVSGRLHSSTYKDKDGNTRSSYNIIAQEVSFGDTREEKSNVNAASDQPKVQTRQNQAPAATPPQSAVTANGFTLYSAEDFQAVAGDDDLPF